MSRALAGDIAPGSNQRGLAGYLNFTASRRLVSSGAGGCSVAVVFLPPIDLARGASASRVLSGA
jgi:hypothetical protein